MIKLFLLSLISSLVLTPLVKKLARALGAVDQPNRRRVNQYAIPSLGGLAIYFSFILSLVLLGIDYKFYGLIISSSLIVLLGVIDDLYELPALIKLGGQVVAALTLILMGTKIELITNPSGGIYYLGYLALPITLLWLVGVTNTVNLIDGLDGLAAGVSIIAAVTVGIIAYQQGQFEVLLLIVPLVASILGFLPYNLNPAQIFMGDTGSMFLGFTLGAIAIISYLKTITVLTIVISILALGVPMLDTIFAILRRKLAGNPLFKADKEHLHHQLLKIGLKQSEVMIVIYLISIFLAMIAVGIHGANLKQGFILLTSTTLLLGLGAWELKKLNKNLGF
ncbi:MraY family glycosyltransferase [Halanaerobacter jeridensis]|nr:MraY family glycosyltransferase [Halanaerobacter jeridensis]